MGSGLKLAVAAAALFLAGTAASGAMAQVRGVDEGRWGLQTPKKTLQWNDKGRWGVNLEVDQPVDRDVKPKDIEAGAFFRIAPSVRVGGAVRLGDKMAYPEKITPQDREASRVRIETKFRF